MATFFIHSVMNMTLTLRIIQHLNLYLIHWSCCIILSAKLYPASSIDDLCMRVETENGEIRNIFGMTPEIGSSLASSSQIENICKDMLFFNLTAAKIIEIMGLTDLNQEFVWITFLPFLIFEELLANNEPFVISIVPISENINNIT